MSPSVNYLFSLVLYENVICFIYPLSPRKTTYKKTDKETKNRHTDKHTSKQTDRQTKIQTHKQQTSKQTLNNGLLFSSTYPSLADIAKWQTSLFFSWKDFILICRTESIQLFVNHFPLGKRKREKTINL